MSKLDQSVASRFFLVSRVDEEAQAHDPSSFASPVALVEAGLQVVQQGLNQHPKGMLCLSRQLCILYRSTGVSSPVLQRQGEHWANLRVHLWLKLEEPGSSMPVLC